MCVTSPHCERIIFAAIAPKGYYVLHHQTEKGVFLMPFLCFALQNLERNIFTAISNDGYHIEYHQTKKSYLTNISQK